MPKILSAEQVRQWVDDGYIAPLPVMKTSTSSTNSGATSRRPASFSARWKRVNSSWMTDTKPA